MDSLEFAEPAREMARNFFLAAPNDLINNPDKKNGVNLHIDYNYSDAAIPPTTWTDPPWAEFHEAERQYFGTEEERAHPNKEMLLKAKRRVYRYCIFGDQFDPGGSAGYAEDIPARNFVVTLGKWTPRGGNIRA
jgi:hypothetical protein